MKIHVSVVFIVVLALVLCSASAKLSKSSTLSKRTSHQGTLTRKVLIKNTTLMPRNNNNNNHSTKNKGLHTSSSGTLIHKQRQKPTPKSSYSDHINVQEDTVHKQQRPKPLPRHDFDRYNTTKVQDNMVHEQQNSKLTPSHNFDRHNTTKIQGNMIHKQQQKLNPISSHESNHHNTTHGYGLSIPDQPQQKSDIHHVNTHPTQRPPPHDPPYFQSSTPPPYSIQSNYSPPINYPSKHNAIDHEPVQSTAVQQPATIAIVPQHTIYVVHENRKQSEQPKLSEQPKPMSEPSVGAKIVSAVESLAKMFKSNPDKVHTYPKPPPVKKPTPAQTPAQSAQTPAPTTVTYITNNYFITSDIGKASSNSSGLPAATGPVQPAVTSGAVQDPISQPTPASQTNQESPASGGKENLLIATNDVTNTTLGQPQNSSSTNDSDMLSDENLIKFTEELFNKQDNNLNQYVKLHLQKRVNDTEEDNATPDGAPESLFTLKPELDSIPSVAALRALYDNYQRDSTQKENVTLERKNEENLFLDEIVKTPVMMRAIDWLVENKFVEPDDYEKKDFLRRMWFNNFNGTSSGFERIFLSEKFNNSGIIGLQNWLYFAHLESQKNIDYLGYADQMNLGDKGSLLKLHYKTEGFTIQNATIFVGTAPELELALYTVCFYARPNNWCLISLGGVQFFLFTHSFRYYSKDLIDMGFPAF